MFLWLRRVLDRRRVRKSKVNCGNDNNIKSEDNNDNDDDDDENNNNMINRGYYTVARRYEVSWVSAANEWNFFPRENKLRIFKPTCNFLLDRKSVV